MVSLIFEGHCNFPQVNSMSHFPFTLSSLYAHHIPFYLSVKNLGISPITGWFDQHVPDAAMGEAKCLGFNYTPADMALTKNWVALFNSHNPH